MLSRFRHAEDVPPRDFVPARHINGGAGQAIRARIHHRYYYSLISEDIVIMTLDLSWKCRFPTCRFEPPKRHVIRQVARHDVYVVTP